MDKRNMEQPAELPFDIEEDLGTIVDSELLCPGVYYAASEGDGRFAQEYYIIERGASCISEAAKAYGKLLPHHPELLACRIDEPEGGRDVIKYEISRYRKKNGLPLPDGESLLTIASYAMENNPEYFGSFPAPIHTPRGTMTRYKTIINGVIALETDQCERMVAVCYPMWETALSDYAKQLGEQTAYDKEQGIDETMGYLFFKESDGALALFELAGEFPEILSSGLLDLRALHNALWQNHPQYSVIYNRDEQNGLHDAFAMLLSLLGVDAEPVSYPDRLIRLTMDAGTDYLRF
ncbi:MAG: hypothetical protein E7425_06855 [Ruminococcaceae bacterium]|nr:hypothetical protein [Oscillospiraceae bacterium]